MAREQEGEQMVFDVNRIRQLIELMNEHELNEIDLRNADRRIRLRRGATDVAVLASPPMASMPMAAPAAPAQAPVTAAATPTPVVDEKAIFIKSPMVGSFYSRPKPTAAAYIKVGDVVQPDTIVCMIEAMKTFNEMPAGIAGKVVEVLVKDEEPVDVNKPLFKLVPA